MKYKKTILLLFLASQMVTLGGVPAKVDKADHEVDRSRFKALYLDKNIFDHGCPVITKTNSIG